MKKSTRRLLAFFAAAAMALSLTACTGETGENGGTQTGDVPEGKVFAEGTEISMIIPSHASWPYDENWVVYDYIEEATGAKFNIQAIPGADMYTKLPLIIANKSELPDMIYTFDKRAQVDTYALSGAFVSYSDNMDKMTNMQKFLDGLDATEAEELVNSRRSGDGKIYSPPEYGTQRVSGMRTWLYRKDIFEKNNLKVPETYEEMYQVAKKLKELYPDSYPICYREGIARLNDLAPAWQNDLSYQPYYDFDKGEWKVGAKEPIMKDIVEYYRKLVDEGLINPDFLTTDTKAWEELMSTDRGFITVDYAVRIDFFNSAVRLENPEYTLALMKPPVPNVATGSAKLAKTNLATNGWVICNTGKEDAINNAFKFVDWLYSDEAVQLLSWGKEGETYTIDADGKNQFILSEGERVSTKYGITSYGYQVIVPEAYESTYTKENIDACIESLNYLEEQTNPRNWMAFNDDEDNRVAAIWDDMDAYIAEEMSKFILGQTPMSDWEKFQKGIEDMGEAELIEIFTGAYNRAMGK